MKPIYVLLVLALALSVPSAFAEIEKGKNYDREYLGLIDGRHLYQWTTTPERIVDYYNVNGKPVYADYRLFEDSSIVQLETANSGSLVWDKATCSYNYYNSGFITPLNKPVISGISWTVKGKEITNPTWSKLNGINNAACTTTVQTTQSSTKIIGTKSNTSGTFQIVLDYVTGRGIKETMRGYNNNPAWNNHVVGFTETFQVPQTITLGNQTYDLSSYNNTRLDRGWIQNHKAQFIKLSDKLAYDVGLGFSNLDSILITWDGTKAKLSFDYLYVNSIVPYQTWIEVDPTFGYTVGTGKNTRATVANCATGTGADSPGTNYIGSDVTYCYRTGVYWDISSISTDATITDVSYRHDVGVAGGTVFVCDMNSIEGNLSTMTNQQIYVDVADGTNFVNNNVDCDVAGTNFVVDLGASADADLQAELGVDTEWAIGLRADPDNGGANAWATQTDPEIQVTYTVPLQPPTNLEVLSISPTTLNVTWSSTGVVSGFRIDRESPIGNGFATLDWNTTTAQTYYLDSNNGTSPATVYNYRVFAHNTTETSSASDPAHNFTRANAPTILEANSVSKTQIDLSWVAPSGTIRGYLINHGTTCAGLSTLVTNTTTTATTYSHTGLGEGTEHCYTVQALTGNSAGASSASNTAQNATFTTTTGTNTVSTGIIGDVIQINSTITITDANPSPVTISQSVLVVNGTIAQTRAETIQINNGSSDTLDPFWYQMTNPNAIYLIYARATVSNNTGTVTLQSSNVTGAQEYDPAYAASLTDPSTLGIVNYTVVRFDDEDGILLKVNRDDVAVGTTWNISCITQTNAEAASTRNQSATWPGTWVNYSTVGYFNGSWTGFVNTHGYITCINPPNILFTTTSFTNSSLALLGIQIFDESYGSMLGVPVGVFFLVLVAGMASKRTAPTFIIVVLGMAGVLATLLFFTINPLVWGLALVTGLLGALVNQKVF